MKTRRRRTAEEARFEILEAAEKRLDEAGPAGIRLQEIAADVGISHPAVLHHFKSREVLVKAVVERALMKLQADLVGTFAVAGDSPPDGAMMFERVFETFSARGHARLLAWLVLSGYDDVVDSPESHTNWQMIIAATHAFRTHGPAGKKRKSKSLPDLEDTRFAVLLSSLALFGLALIGKVTFRQAGFGSDRDAETRFRRWLASLIEGHFEAS